MYGEISRGSLSVWYITWSLLQCTIVEAYIMVPMYIWGTIMIMIITSYGGIGPGFVILELCLPHHGGPPHPLKRGITYVYSVRVERGQ
jgi:hypothetical protein